MDGLCVKTKEEAMRNDFFLQICGNMLADTAFDVRLPNGETEVLGKGRPAFSLVFKTMPNLNVADPILSLGEAYMRGELELEGDIDAAARLLNGRLETRTPHARLRRLIGLCSRALSAGRAKQRLDIKAHYDLGNDFYSLWLDPGMNYSCAYFIKPDDSLEQAQRQKIELILRKLRLAPGMRLLDIGCGWGALAVRAAKDYGCKVLGVTLSDEQCAEGSRRAALAAPGMVDIRLRNYLDLEGKEQFDRVVSVGMFEHVGRANMPSWFAAAARLLKPGGLCLLHTLTKPLEGETNAWTEKYIFPGGRIPSLREIIALPPEYGFHVLHVENLRPHYAKTLEAWHANFSAPKTLAKVREMFGDRFIRMWSLYLRMAAACLRAGVLEVHQIVLGKGVDPTLPLTLNDIYAPEAK